MKGKRPAEPKTFIEFEALLETVEGLKLDSDGKLAMRYCGVKKINFRTSLSQWIRPNCIISHKICHVMSCLTLCAIHITYPSRTSQRQKPTCRQPTCVRFWSCCDPVSVKHSSSFGYFPNSPSEFIFLLQVAYLSRRLLDWLASLFYFSEMLFQCQFLLAIILCLADATFRTVSTTLFQQASVLIMIYILGVFSVIPLNNYISAIKSFKTISGVSGMIYVNTIHKPRFSIS